MHGYCLDYSFIIKMGNKVDPPNYLTYWLNKQRCCCKLFEKVKNILVDNKLSKTYEYDM